MVGGGRARACRRGRVGQGPHPNAGERAGESCGLDDELAADTEALARAEGVSLNETAKQALTEAVERRRQDPEFKERVRRSSRRTGSCSSGSPSERRVRRASRLPRDRCRGDEARRWRLAEPLHDG